MRVDDQVAMHPRTAIIQYAEMNDIDPHILKVKILTAVTMVRIYLVVTGDIEESGRVFFGSPGLYIGSPIGTATIAAKFRDTSGSLGIVA
jgi:hypothetical protein